MRYQSPTSPQQKSYKPPFLSTAVAQQIGEAIVVGIGVPALAADRDVLLRRFGHFLLTALLPSPGGLALHPDPQSPRFDVVFGPPKAGRENPGEKDWRFPGPLLFRLQRPQEQELTLLGQLIRPSRQADLLVLHLLLETF
jgi:hypothetical protein